MIECPHVIKGKEKEEKDEMFLRLFLKEKGIIDEDRIQRIKKNMKDEETEADKFWVERRNKKYKDIIDFSIEELREKHKEELNKIHNKQDAENIGILLMGDYYLEGFSSRRCSRKMSELVGHRTIYMDFYGSSCYYFMMRR